VRSGRGGNYLASCKYDRALLKTILASRTDGVQEKGPSTERRRGKNTKEGSSITDTGDEVGKKVEKA